MTIHVAIAIGLVGGLAFGLLASSTGSPALIATAEGIAPLGTAFVNLIKMVVVPLVATTLFSGVAGLGDIRKLGKVGGVTLLFFWGTTFVSIVIGMTVMTLMLPLASVEVAGEGLRSLAGIEIPGVSTAQEIPGPIAFVLGLIPDNPLRAAAEGALLPLIVFVALLGAAAATLKQEDNERLVGIADSLTAALVKLVNWILLVAPVGVFALAAPVTSRTGWAMLQSLAIFVVAIVVGLALFVSLIYVPAVKFLGQVNAIPFLRSCVGPQAIAFSTTSSAATLPAMLEVADKDLKISRFVASFVLSLGASINRAGSALFQGTAIVFLANLYGVPISLSSVGAVVLATFLVSLTVASVPAASVVTLAPALNTVGVPLEGLAVLLGVDRIPDMFRTATNVTGHLTTAVVVNNITGRNTDVGRSEIPHDKG